eukprot:13515553-Ditylum_brightwellii.AAC.1
MTTATPIMKQGRRSALKRKCIEGQKSGDDEISTNETAATEIDVDEYDHEGKRKGELVQPLKSTPV